MYYQQINQSWSLTNCDGKYLENKTVYFRIAEIGITTFECGGSGSIDFLTRNF